MAAFATNLIFRALKTRLNAKLTTQFPGGFHEAEAPERTHRPYVVATQISEVTDTRTNRSKYQRVSFTLTVCADKFEQAGTLAKQLNQVVEEAPLALDDGATLCMLYSDPMTILPKEEQLEKAQLSYESLVAVARNQPA